MFKKKIVCVATLDLTNYSPEALRRIKAIVNCATLFLPENPSNEFMEAFSEIKLTNVARIIKFPTNKIVCNSNGFEILSNVNPKNLYITNGLAIVVSAMSDEPVQFISNGELIYNENVNVDFISSNGSSAPVKFDYEKTKIYQDMIEINADFIRNSEEGIYIICINKIKISGDVTDEMLKEKNIHFICTNRIYCKKDVYGYVAANSQICNKIITDEKEYNNFIIK